MGNVGQNGTPAMSTEHAIPKRFPSQLGDRIMACSDPSGELMIQLELEFAQQLDADRIARSVDLALDAEPVLGCRFVRHWRKPWWERLEPGARKAFLPARDEAEYESFKTAPADACTGPQIGVCLLNLSDAAMLLIKVSHYAADAAGVREVSRIISSIYDKLGSDPDFVPEPNRPGSRSVGEILKGVRWTTYPRLYWQFQRDTWASQVPRATLTLSFRDGPPEALSFINRLLPREQVSFLVDYGRKHEATLNDLLVAAFLRALAAQAGLDGHRQLRVTTTVDCRRYVTDDQAPAVANLSLGVLGWPNLGTDLGQDFASTLARVASITRRRKRSFVGLDNLIGFMVWPGPLPHALATRFVQQYFGGWVRQGNFPHALTNMGAIDPSAVTYGASPLNARLLPPPSTPPHFALGVSGYDGTLTISTGVYGIQWDMAESFLDAMVGELPH